VLGKGEDVLVMMPYIFDDRMRSGLHNPRDLTNGLGAILCFINIVDRRVRYYDVERIVSERQLPHVRRLHNNAFRYSLSPRIFQCGFRAVAREIRGLPDVYSRRPASIKPFCGSDEEQTATATDVEYLFVTRPGDSVQQPLPATQLPDSAVPEHPQAHQAAPNAGCQSHPCEHKYRLRNIESSG